MGKLAVVQDKLDRLENKRKRVKEEQRDVIRNSLIRCMMCSRRSRLSSWVFIQDQWYVRPYSCTDGDYWSPSATEVCHIVCPKCSKENYLYNHSQRDRIVELIDSHQFAKTDLFKEVEERRRR